MAIYPFQNVRILPMYRFHNKVFNAGKPAFNLLTLSARYCRVYPASYSAPFGYTKGLFSFVFFQHHCVTTALFNAVVTQLMWARAEQGIDMVRRSL